MVDTKAKDRILDVMRKVIDLYEHPQPGTDFLNGTDDPLCKLFWIKGKSVIEHCIGCPYEIFSNHLKESNRSRQRRVGCIHHRTHKAVFSEISDKYEEADTEFILFEDGWPGGAPLISMINRAEFHKKALIILEKLPPGRFRLDRPWEELRELIEGELW